MGSRIAAIATLVVGGLIVADIWIHPQGTQAAGNAASQILTPTVNGLLGQPSKVG